ncbi:MAG: hypothetical protein IPL01_15055 [Acidobacteria bacterium]|nr:hypothetical protein [Acidobacteriota bacterium]
MTHSAGTLLHKKCLAPNGLIVANIVGGFSGSASKVVSSVVATMEPVFGKISVYSPNWLQSGKNPNLVTTMFLVAGELPENPAPFTMKVSEEIRRTNYIDSVFASKVELSRDQAIILTDGYAPLEAWSDAAVRAMRY